MTNYNSGIVLVDIWAPWCSPCRMMNPIIESIGEKYKDKIGVLKINADEENDFIKKYDIMSLPTFLFFKNGEIVKKIIGATSELNLTKIIDELLD